MVTPSTLERLNLVCANKDARQVGSTAIKAVFNQQKKQAALQKYGTRWKGPHQDIIRPYKPTFSCYKEKIPDASQCCHFSILEENPRMMVIGGMSSSIMMLNKHSPTNDRQFSALARTEKHSDLELRNAAYIFVFLATRSWNSTKRTYLASNPVHIISLQEDS